MWRDYQDYIANKEEYEETEVSEEEYIQWLKKCPHVSQILKDSVIARHILNIRPNAWWLT